jgi:hypothetical protein
MNPRLKPLRTRSSSSLAFAAPPFALTVASRAFEVFLHPGRHQSDDLAPHVPPPSLTDSVGHPGHPGVSTRVDHPDPCEIGPYSYAEATAATSRLADANACTAWGCSHPAASPHLSLEVPLRRFSAPAVHSRLCMPRHAHPSARSSHRAGPVPPSWFLTTSTASSGITMRALLQLAADPGVHRVSRWSAPARLVLTKRTPRQNATTDPHDALTPRRYSPPSAPDSLTTPPRRAACHANLCPRAVLRRGTSDAPGCASAPRVLLGGCSTTLSTSRLCSVDGSFAPVRRCQRPRRSVLPWASALPSTTATRPGLDGARSDDVLNQRAVERITSKNGTEVRSPR